MSSLCHMDLQNLLLGEVLFFFSGLMTGPTYRPLVRHSNADTPLRSAHRTTSGKGYPTQSSSHCLVQSIIIASVLEQLWPHTGDDPKHPFPRRHVDKNHTLRGYFECCTFRRFMQPVVLARSRNITPILHFSRRVNSRQRSVEQKLCSSRTNSPSEVLHDPAWYNTLLSRHSESPYPWSLKNHRFYTVP